MLAVDQVSAAVWPCGARWRSYVGRVIRGNSGERGPLDGPAGPRDGFAYPRFTGAPCGEALAAGE